MRKIFLVEDDQAIREVSVMVLTSENYDVQSFSTVSTFTERDINVTSDLYMFDVMLPYGSGIDLCEEIKNDVENKDIPIIIMSAHATLDHICQSCQPDDFIPKPFDIDNLLLKVQKIIENK
ncbi:response regulator [Chryseobacterium balustinum]|uniref:Response regulator ArlR n=1 Tax=Chryseobacterium balustinum TaxID=246 RepID=A0AAX2IPT8_9FLAO|nr:response regulator [Chryseobacterium balustinum]AZB28683.1 response regulator [Chryseobacterium balustinum]SKC06922.1 Response regulator receiver domain-containing protein [Chryseobacterium balustinum]SQA91817.1 Response regulator ArlR [Chryseobacterium balustinum]